MYNATIFYEVLHIMHRLMNIAFPWQIHSVVINDSDNDYIYCYLCCFVFQKNLTFYAGLATLMFIKFFSFFYFNIIHYKSDVVLTVHRR
jgi:hypothetical protein